MSASRTLPLSGSVGLVTDARLGALRILHGVTTRALGDMKDPEARRAALKAAGLAGDVRTLRQVHGTAVAGSGSPAQAEADGWIFDDRNAAPVGVYVADCLPIFLWEKSGRAAGVFHSGWRGTAAGMPRTAVTAFVKRGLPAGALEAWIGPHIASCCYRVGNELEGKFKPASFLRREQGLYLDLAEEARAQLIEAGVPRTAIEVSRDCTSCRPEFFSYRRDKQDQRMLAFLAWPHGR